jgi:hypothetical protein
VSGEVLPAAPDWSATQLGFKLSDGGQARLQFAREAAGEPRLPLGHADWLPQVPQGVFNHELIFGRAEEDADDGLSPFDFVLDCGAGVPLALYRVGHHLQ